MPTKAPSLLSSTPNRVPPLQLRRNDSSWRNDRNSSISSCESQSTDRPKLRGRNDTQKSAASAEDAQETFIKVIVRVRPKLPNERRVTDGVEVHAGMQSLMLSNMHNNTKTFFVDHVFDSREGQGSQESFFRQFGQDYVNLSLSGYNVCMFAYGHTGSGKTYTMLGDRGSDAHGTLAGIIPRFLQDLFDRHATHQVEKRQYTCEFFEVYNEHIKDLLVPLKSGDRTRKVHVHPKHGVSVENLTHSVVVNADEALQLVEYGNQMRAVATTTMNARSSRSHAIFTFNYEQTCDGKSCQSTVTFVDLAGREDQAASQNQAQTFREMCCINTSLFHLANVITKLTQGAIDRRSLADFRNSKLTLLLSPALIGNSKTALIATVAPLKSFYDDSVSTLNFAASVKKIKTRPVVNNKNSNVVVAELEKEIRRLQSDLSVSKTGEEEKERALLCAEALIAKYKRSWEEAVSKSQVYNRKRRQSLSQMGLPDLENLGIEMDYNTPFLTKLSDDPSLQGRCNYMLNRTTLCIGSDEKNCTLVLHGLGILPQMCEVYCEDGVVEISLCNKEADPPPRVLVDGYPLSASNGTRSLEHGSCIFLGYSHAFRLVVPPDSGDQVTSGAPDLCILARETVDKLDMASAVCEIVDESGEQFKEILPFVTNLESRAPNSTVQDFISAIHRICPLIDEANMITREIFGNEGLFFQLHALTNVFNFANDFPEVVVCVLQNSEGTAKFKRCVQTVLHNLHENKKHADDSVTEGTPRESATSLLLGKAHHPFVHAMGLSDHMCIDKSPLVYVWSLEKFLWRLNAIRDFYHDGCEAKDKFQSVRKLLADHPFMSPWREVALSEGMLIQAANSVVGHRASSKYASDNVSDLSATRTATSEEAAPILSPSVTKSPAGSSSKGYSASPFKHRKFSKGAHADSGDDSSSIGSGPNSQGCSSTMCAAYESSAVASVAGSIDSVLQQQTEWNKALGEKVESMSADIVRLRGALLSPRQQSPPPGMMHEGSKDVTSWLSQVDVLRDTLATLRNCTEEVERLAIQKREGEPDGEAMANRVIEQVQSLRSDVANIVKEELKDQLSNLKPSLSVDGSALSGHTTPLHSGGKFEAVVYTPRLSSGTSRDPMSRGVSSEAPRRLASSASLGLQACMVRNNTTPSLLRKSSSSSSRHLAYPTSSFMSAPSYVAPPRRSSMPSPRRTSMPLSYRTSMPQASYGSSLRSVQSSMRSAGPSRSPSEGPSRRTQAIPSLRSVQSSLSTGSASSMATSMPSASVAGSRKSSRSPNRRLVGPYPKVTWCYYEIPDFPEQSSASYLGSQQRCFQ